MNLIKKELLYFLIVGLLTVTIDFTLYWITQKFLLNITIAKVTGFISGTIFSFLANRKITFKSLESIQKQLLKFSIIYACTMIINVLINNYLLKHQPFFRYQISFAFIIATLTSASMNFIGMKYFVFFKNKNI